MARAASTRTANAKPIHVKAIGATQRRSEKKVEEVPLANNTNGTSKEMPQKALPRGRVKKAISPTPEPQSMPSEKPKRKKDDEDEAEAERSTTIKRAKINGSQAVTKPLKPARVAKEISKLQPKGPRRVRGQKTQINSVRYTEPLKVFVFGEGSSGELGFGATRKAIDVKRPRFNEALTNHKIVRIAAGGMHVVALTKDNKILTWGVNDNGALGRDTSNADIKMRDIDANDADSESEDETGGLNDLEATPTAISSEHFPPDTIFVDIAAGDSCSFVLTTEGAVYGWGTFRKNEGILGFERGNRIARFPVYIHGISKITQIVCGTNHVFALDTERHVYAWGNGQQNQLGRRVTERTLTESLQPNRVGFHDSFFKGASRRIVRIFSGDYHGLAMAEDGHVWAWGANNYCETGFSENAGAIDASVLAPKIVRSLEGKNIQELAAGSHHNIAIDKKGQVFAWGRCDGSQTGIPEGQLNAERDEAKILKNNGKAKILVEPAIIPNLNNIITGACGPDHTIVIDSNGKAYSWGFSANYQTGQGTDDDVEIPTMIDNTAVRNIKLTWSGCGGQYSILASKVSGDTDA